MQDSSTQEVATSKDQDIVVPVRADYPELTPAFLNSLLDLSPADPACIILAVVDGDGTVVLNRLYRGIHAPAENFSGVAAKGSDTRATGS